MFSPYRKNFSENFTTVLIVGSEGTGKHDIGRQVTDMGKSINLKVHTCTSLPLPEDSAIHATGVQFVCFVMSLANKDSMTVLLDNIGKVDVTYFLGRSVIIANTKGCSTDVGVPQAQLTNLASQYGIPVLFSNSEVDEERTEVSRKILNMVECRCGTRTPVCPLVYEGLGLTLAAEDQSLGQPGTMSRQMVTPSLT